MKYSLFLYKYRFFFLYIVFGTISLFIELVIYSFLDHKINNLIISVNTLFKNETDKRDINWKLNLAETPVIINLDISLFEQVLVNIIKNAIEAIDQNGEITITTVLKPDPCLIIKDNGCGITTEIQKNLFLPFYSTKKNGQGIGLTLIREILVMHEFYFSLETTSEGQTEFTIRFNQ